MKGLVSWGELLQGGGLCVLLFVIPFSIAAVELSFLLLSVGWLLERLQPGGWRASVWARRSSRWALVSLVTYVAICASSILTSSDPFKSLEGLIGKTLEYTLFFIMVADVGRKPGIVRYAFITLFVSAALVGGDAVAQEVFGREPIRGHRLYVYGRMTGPYTNPIDLGTYLMTVVPLCLAWMAHERSRRNVLLLGALVLLLTGCLIRTESQSAWLGFGVALATLWILDRRLRKPLMVFGSSFVAVAGGLLFVVRRLVETVTFTDMGIKDRLFMWQAAWHMIQAHPIIGLGLNTFMANYLAFWVGGEQQPRYAHNCYLQTWAETGLLGLGTFLWFLGTLVVCWIRSVGRMPDGVARTVLVGLTASLLGFLAQAGLDTNFYTVRQAALFWTLAGFAFTLTQPANVAAHPSRP